MIIKTYTIAKAIINEASKKYEPELKLNEKDLEIFKQYCDVIDSIGDEFKAEGVSVYINETDMTIGIAIDMPDIVIQDPAQVFYEIAIRSGGFVVKMGHDEDNIQLCMVFPSLWIKA